MKAIIYHKYGTPDELKLVELSRPLPKPREVLVKVHAASINSWDWDLLRGKPLLVRIIGGLLKPKQKILGADIAGVVDSVGSNTVDFKPGDEVFGDIAHSGFGGFAEYVSVPEKLLAKKSSAMSFEQAAALPQAGLLALQGLLYGGKIKHGQQLLINGAGGGVGTLALQYGVSCGAYVDCVDLPEKFDLLKSLGATHCIDYTTEDYTRIGKQYDLILDVIAHRTIADYRRALKPGGTFSMIGGSMGSLLLKLMLFGSEISRRAGKKLGIMGYRTSRKDLNTITQLFETGKLVPVVDRIYPLSDTSEAFRYFGTGKVKGKIIIKVKEN
jgi:NADPH:quinone reductase-like Zn-dependent oxidoreductase